MIQQSHSRVYIQKKNPIIKKKYMYPYNHRSTIHNNQDMERA